VIVYCLLARNLIVFHNLVCWGYF